MTPVVLTVAGSDPSGGAGIQGDLRTFAALGVLGVSAITALTVQNSRGVGSVHPVSADLLAAQLEAVLSDTNVAAVKIGMLGGAEQVQAVAAALRRYAPPHCVLDPVLASTGEIPLLDKAGRAALLTDLMPMCAVITPNVPELGLLTGLPVGTEAEREAAAKQLQTRGAHFVLVKGGHLSGSPVDVLYGPSADRQVYGGTRLETVHTHGTGCLLSSALASFLARDIPMPSAVRQAKDVVTRALSAPVVIGKGRGYPDAVQGERRRPGDRRTHAQRLLLLRGVYVVTDPTLRAGRDSLQTAFAAVQGGAGVVQIREKSGTARDLLRSAETFLHSPYAAQALLIVNDRADVAFAVNADGVHLGPDDIRPEDARRLLGPEKLVGVSVAAVREAQAAAPFASYFGVGAIYGSRTKKDAGEAIGTGRIGEIKAAFPQIPVVAIGGITAQNIGAVMAAGADAAAVVSAVVAAPDMVEATRALVNRARQAAARADGV